MFILTSVELYTSLAVLLLSLLAAATTKVRKFPTKLPIVNGRKWYELGYSGVKQRFHADIKGLLRSGFEQCSNAFYLCTESRNTLVLSPKYADLIRNDDRLSLARVAGAEFHEGLAGFEPLSYVASEERPIQKVISQKITRSLGYHITPISLEADHAIRRVLGDGTTWKKAGLRHSIEQITGQVQARVFLDDDLCREPAWLQITTDITSTFFSATRALRRWPDTLRPFIVYFLPSCREAKRKTREAQSLLKPLIMKRKDAFDSKGNSGMSTIDWFLESADGCGLDLAFLQLGLSIAALDTSTDGLCNLLVNLTGLPKAVNDLRAEIVKVIGKMGLNKASLQKLELMDSAMKESQRLGPLGFFGMQRQAVEEVVLPDGIIIPKDSFLTVSTLHMMDSSVWLDGEIYDPYRFFNMRRNGGNDPTTQFVTTSPNHLGFGHGKQACPGRFVAANVTKVILCHILLKYDFEVTGQEEGHSEIHGYNLIPSPKLNICFKRRQEEIAL